MYKSPSTLSRLRGFVNSDEGKLTTSVLIASSFTVSVLGLDLLKDAASSAVILSTIGTGAMATALYQAAFDKFPNPTLKFKKVFNETAYLGDVDSFIDDLRSCDKDDPTELVNMTIRARDLDVIEHYQYDQVFEDLKSYPDSNWKSNFNILEQQAGMTLNYHSMRM